MNEGNRTGRRTGRRDRALRGLVSGIEQEEGRAAQCPKCGGKLEGVAPAGGEGGEGVMRCRSCGYFFVARG
jgi:DNA-directed RNA polymerase subunit RPC12/RpoP